MNHIVVLVILFPLLGCLLCPAISRLSVNAGKRIVMGCLFCSFVLCLIQLFIIISSNQSISYWVGGWEPPVGIELVVDGVSGTIMVMVSLISFLTSLYSSPFENPPSSEWLRSGGYYTMLGFLAIGLLGMCAAGDAFNLYVFMEITAISGYGLIAVGDGKGPIAAFRYLLMGTVGASMYLLGLGFLYAATGTLNMHDLTIRLETLQNSPLVILSVACMIVGFGIKMALFPLHGWQPAAHSYAHPAADPMIAGVMIKVPAYAMLRFFFCIFDENSRTMELFFDVIGVMAVCGVIFGSVKALRYSTYNKILAYSSIGQVGYIAMGFAIGNYYGLIGAILHIVNHAFMKAGLFYTSGALKYKYGIHETTDFGQIYRDMPVAGTTITVCALSMIGIPPFAGFFSKWYLALGAVENKQYGFVAVLIISSLLGIIYFFRILEHLYMDKKTITIEDKKIPWQMIIPLAAVIIAVIGLGVGNSWIVNVALKSTITEVFLS